MFYFFDTSALLKHYRNELGTDVVDRIFNTENNQIFISSFSIVELFSVIEKLFRKGIITGEEVSRVTYKFQSDIDFRRVGIINISPGHISKTYNLIFGLHLSATDSLILASALSIEPEKAIFVCSDEFLLRAAEKSGLETLNPLE